MESWRERGFVPDSDSEDGFDSQDSKELKRGFEDDDDDGFNEHAVPATVHTKNISHVPADGREKEDGNDASGDDDAEIFRPASPSLSDADEVTPGSKNQDGAPSTVENPAQDMPGSLELNEECSMEEDTAATKATGSLLASSPPAGHQPSTPRAKLQDDIWEVPSSPDELQLDYPPSRKPIAFSSKSKNDSQVQPVEEDDIEEDDNLSPLSSPPSILDSMPLDEDDEKEPSQHDEEDDEEQAESQPRPNLEHLLPRLELPEEILEELHLPARRSLRQRNPIQLHPYLLEDAKYKSLMKDSGIKPVRIAQSQQSLHTAANESQGQDFVPPSSSPVAEFQFPPSSPAEPQQIPEKRSHVNSPERRSRLNLQLLPRSPNSTTAPHSKRRKVSRPEDDRPRRLQHLSRPQVIIDNSPTGRENSSIFDIPPSPPQSGSVSSTQTVQQVEGFRFPRGFSPPTLTTPVTESGLKLRNADDTDPGPMDWSDPDAGPGPVDAESTSSQSQPNSDTEEEKHPEEDEEMVVRSLQRRIKGVLPASWLRLDQQKQKDARLNSTQRNRDKTSSHMTENAKGVARKTTRKIDATGSNSKGQQALFSHLAELDSDDSSGEEEGGGGFDSRKALAELVGFDDPFYDQDIGDDIPEDNRIDDMFPSISRAPSAPRNRKQEKKRLRPEREGIGSNSFPKRPRLKRQTRLTDPEYAGRKEKHPARNHPKLSILDAPDVVDRPRKEQPQFLRVAARKARTRKDMGRRSPSHKFFKLGSRLDTEDANTSLREWRRGNLRQKKLPQLQTRSHSRQPLMDLSTNEQVIANDRYAQRTNKTRVTDAGIESPAGETGDGLSQSSSPNASTPTATLNNTAVSKKPKQSEQQGNKWVIRRNLAVLSLQRNTPRPTEPEVTTASNNSAFSSLFQRSLSLLNRDYRQKRVSLSEHRSLPLDRYLSSNISTTVPARTQQEPLSERSNTLNETPSKSQNRARHRQLRKRPPRRLDVNAVNSQESPTILSPDPEPSAIQGETSQPLNRPFGGLNSFQRSYSIDFNITPLCSGTFFHESTFVGSGQFSRSLELAKRDLDNEAGFSHIKLGDRMFRWGSWNDTVSSELGVAFDMMIEEIEKNLTASPEAAAECFSNHACAIYESLIKYVTASLSFIDPIDRLGFVKTALSLVSKISDHLTTMGPMNVQETEYLMRITSYNLVFSNQVCQIACHALIDDTIANEGVRLVKSASRQLITLISGRTAQAGIRKFLEENKSRERRDAGIRDDQPAVEGYLVAQHVLFSTDKYQGFFEDLITEAYSLTATGDFRKSKDISCLENGWRSMFTTLPLNEIDPFGIARLGSRFRETRDNWSLIKQLLRPVLDDYDANSATQPISYNNYCRALFHRCFHLINGWGWRDCKPILDTLYDFFAKNTLYNLKFEESDRSPAFLDELDRNPSLEVGPGDPCFHILLKILASGLRFLSMVYDRKKIRNFAWRLLPNHGRVYPKEKPIHQADLDALRNHHDLLCTLYYAVPDGCRPRLEAIKNLVHPASSHRETCNINLRSWARLVRFKLSTDEDASGLDQFADWHCYFLTEFLKQHSLARKEIEAQSTADNRFSHQLIEKTISKNQRQIESLLKTALNELGNAVQSSPTLAHALVLVSKTPIRAVLGLFNPRVARINSTISEALQVIVAYIQKCNPEPAVTAAPANATATTDEESQEYGDWTDIEAIYDEEPSPPNPGIEHVEKLFHPAISRLVSNCFGEDHCPEDAILLGVVDCWTSIAQTLVKHGLRRWDNYLSPYDGDSWAALRSTMQTRKFTSQFLANCIEKDARFISECRLQILSMWMSSLVERSSILKFQHRLTEALLNQDSMNPILHNLPFSKEGGRYSIALQDISQRRLSLISSLLSDMRKHLEHLEVIESRELSSTRQEYRELIQKMMSSMKENYQELGNGAISAQGAYVDFVHRIVGFLQQHSRDICPIDPFFTDPTSFPLPSTDPTYIVARLKSYEPKLYSEKVAKTLITFVQGVSERAAIDGQQVYLVSQLHACMADTYEAGDPNKPTLRGLLLQCIFPSYIETAFNNPAAWVVSRPIIQVTSLIFKDLLFNMDTTDPNCVASIINIFNSIFQSSYQAIQSIMDNVDKLRDPSVMFTVTSLVEMITSSLPVVDYIDRVTDVGGNLVSQVRNFRQFVLFAISQLEEQPSADEPLDFARFSSAFTTTNITNPTVPNFFKEIRDSAARELQAYTNESWSRHQGKYYFTRRGGHQPQEVALDPSVAVNLDHLPLTQFGDAVQVFLDTLRTLDLFGDSE